MVFDVGYTHLRRLLHSASGYDMGADQLCPRPRITEDTTIDDPSQRMRQNAGHQHLGADRVHHSVDSRVLQAGNCTPKRTGAAEAFS